MLTDEEIVQWLREREVNARRIAAMKQGADRAGWHEDAMFFHRAAEAIDYYRAAYSRKIDEVAKLGKALASIE